MPSLHATLGASGANRWMNCPGSVRLSKGIPSTSSPAAVEGTQAHYVCEQALLCGKDAEFYVGECLVEPVVGDFIVPEDMAPHVQKYLDFVRGFENKNTTLFIENRVSLEKVWKGMFGTTDAIIVEQFGALHVIDFKYGINPVEVEENEQLMFYGLGSLLANVDSCVESVHLHVVQPRAIHPNGPIRSWETTPERLMDFGKELRRAGKETEKPDASLKSGTWCQYCPAAGTCPEYHDASVANAMIEFEGNEMKTPSADQLTPEQINRIITNKKMIEGFLKAVEARALTDMMEKKKIEGLKIVRGRSTRYWIKDEDKIENDLCERGVDFSDIHELKMKTITKMEKEFGKEITLGLTEKSEGKLTVAPIGDRRKEVEFKSAEEDFGAIEQIDEGFLE